MTLTCDKARWYEDSEGFWMAFRTRDRAQAAQLAPQIDKPYVIEAKPERKRRSLDANAYLWVLLDHLSAALRTPKIELYRRLIPDIGGNCQVVCVQDKAVDKLRDGWEHNGLGWLTDTTPSKLEGCTNVILYYGSSTYDTAQMSRLIDMVISECKAQGIETMRPEELSRLEGYDGQHLTG